MILYENYTEETCFHGLFPKYPCGKNMDFPVQNGQNFGFSVVPNKYRGLRYEAEILCEFYPMKS